MDREEMAEGGAAHPPTPVKEVPKLLDMYSRALDDMAALPLLFPKVPCRPCRWRLLMPLSRLPRLTPVTHILLVRHIDRNLAAIIRHYSVKEALGQLTEEQARDRASCIAFRKSLPPIRLVFMIISVAVPATLIALVLSPLAEKLFVRALKHDRIDETFQLLAEQSIELITGGGGGALLAAIDDATELGVQGDLVLLSIAFIASYLATRPLVSAFRLKRQILCLADQDVLDVEDTASSWYVNKSTGAYDQERRVFKALGLRRQTTERPFDLATLAFPALCMLLFAVGYAWLEAEKSVAEPNLDAGWWIRISFLAYIFFWLASLGLLRFRWLRTTWRDRRSPRSAPPLAYVTSSGDYVESRPITEAAAWPLVMGSPFVLPFMPLLYPIFGVIHFYRLVLTGDRLRTEVARRDGRPYRRGHPLLATAAFVSTVATPIVISVHLWRLCTLLERGHALRKYRALAILACPPLVATVFVFQIFHCCSFPGEGWLVTYSVSFMLITFLFPLLVAAIQRCQNHLIQALATPVPYGQCEKARK